MRKLYAVLLVVLMTLGFMTMAAQADPGLSDEDGIVPPTTYTTIY